MRPFSRPNAQGFAQKRSKPPSDSRSISCGRRIANMGESCRPGVSGGLCDALSGLLPRFETPSPGAGGPGRARARRPPRRPGEPRPPRPGPSRPARSPGYACGLPPPPSRPRGAARPKPPPAARCVTTRICSRAARARSLRPTASAVAPDTPASTSSKTNVRTGPPRRAASGRAFVSSSASAAASASWTRDSSPPDAIFGKRTRRLAGVRREGERHRVDTPGAEGDVLAAGGERARGIRLACDLHCERGPPERQVRQVRLDGLPEPGRRGGPPLRQLERRAAVGGERLLRGRPPAFCTAPSRSASSSRSRPRAARRSIDLGQRRAVLALELRERVEALHEEREARGIGLQLLEVARGLEGHLAETLDRFGERRDFVRRRKERFLRVRRGRRARRTGRAEGARLVGLQRRDVLREQLAPLSRRSASFFLSEEISSSSPSSGFTVSISAIWKSRSSRRWTRSLPASASRARSRWRATRSRCSAATPSAGSSRPANRSSSSRGAAGSRSSRASAWP